MGVAMGWRDLVQSEDESVVLPWVGGRTLNAHGRSLRLEGRLPREHGWCEFKLLPRKARFVRAVEAPMDPQLRDLQKGYLVGDRLIPDEVRIETDPAKLVECTEKVHLLEPGLDRFVRVSAGRPHEGGPLVYKGQEFPLGPEEEVLRAYQDEAKDLRGLAGVAPALDVAFRFESWRRAEAERRRREEQERLEREARERELEERRARLREQLGSAEGRREMARIDFAGAARAALAVGGAEYLDSRDSYNRGEKVVQFRYRERRFECTCSATTLQIIDSGICLTDHATGEQGDTRFTLESFPNVIQQAIDEDKLVVWRHLD